VNVNKLKINQKLKLKEN